jgi:hypothetical protein
MVLPFSLIWPQADSNGKQEALKRDKALGRSGFCDFGQWYLGYALKSVAAGLYS